ncbi:MAG: hypothetical protein AB1726_02355 [Planctomycetota bacterium]
MSPRKKTPHWLKALGRDEPPAAIELPSGRYEIERVFKHDFFALTALYRGEARSVVLKIGRRAGLFGLPLGWIGRLHAWHESRVFERLAHLEIVPEFTGRYGRHGLTHAFVAGCDLREGMAVPDDFFDRLRAGLAAIHALDMAYVDLEKAENILVGRDGRPYLFDFQISWYWPPRWGGNLWPLRWIRRRLQQADRYHCAKLQRRVRPDQMSRDEFCASRVRPVHVRIYSALTRPVTLTRRRILNRIDPRGGRGAAQRNGERGRVPSRPE